MNDRKYSPIFRGSLSCLVKVIQRFILVAMKLPYQLSIQRTYFTIFRVCQCSLEEVFLGPMKISLILLSVELHRLIEEQYTFIKYIIRKGRDFINGNLRKLEEPAKHNTSFHEPYSSTPQVTCTHECLYLCSYATSSAILHKRRFLGRVFCTILQLKLQGNTHTCTFTVQKI